MKSERQFDYHSREIRVIGTNDLNIYRILTPITKRYYVSRLFKVFHWLLGLEFIDSFYFFEMSLTTKSTLTSTPTAFSYINNSVSHFGHF
jgi:hypothetical protein